jgi:hypothetical protein
MRLEDGIVYWDVRAVHKCTHIVSRFDEREALQRIVWI